MGQGVTHQVEEVLAGKAARVEKESIFARFLRSTEIDARLLGMLGALALIWVGFHVYGEVVQWVWRVSDAAQLVEPFGPNSVHWRHGDGNGAGDRDAAHRFVRGLDPWFLCHVDGDYSGLDPAEFLGLGHPMIWIITVICGLIIGCLIGAIHGYLIAYLGIPRAFIVTLGGFAVLRGAAFLLARGETISPVDDTFSKLGGGPYGAIGAVGSWIIGGLACLVVLYMLLARPAKAEAV